MLFTILIFSIIISNSNVFINLEKAWAQTVVATVDVRDSPYDLEYNP